MSSIAFLREILFPAILHSMPPTTADLDRFRDEIEKRLLLNRRTQKQVVNWLQQEGVSFTVPILKNRCKDSEQRKLIGFFEKWIRVYARLSEALLTSAEHPAN